MGGDASAKITKKYIFDNRVWKTFYTLIFRNVSKYMKTHNIVGSSKGYIDRVVASYSSVTVQDVRKYFVSSAKFIDLYLAGETGHTVNKKIAEIRKSHRGAAMYEVDHSSKVYNRHRL